MIYILKIGILKLMILSSKLNCLFTNSLIFFSIYHIHKKIIFHNIFDFHNQLNNIDKTKVDQLFYKIYNG